MRKLYSLAMYLAVPPALAWFAWRGLKDRGYAERWSERFGRGDAQDGRGGLVVHAASVGEVNAAAPLVRGLLEAHPDLPLTLTTFTPTGSRRAQSLFGSRVAHRFAPLDLPGAVSRFFDRTDPRLLVIVETEIWPNLYAEARRRKVPVVLANARLSERSERGYRRAPGLLTEVLSSVAWIGAQSAADAGRLVACGAVAARVNVVGNLKYDLPIDPDWADAGRQLRESWGNARPVLVAGSTHAGDEAGLLSAFSGIRHALPEALLVLAPRHPERFSETARMAQDAGFRVARLSDSAAPTADTACLVVDAMGELMRFYAAADVAFVGGTLAPVGGHNLLEPAALGRPVLFGPHTANAGEIASDLVACAGGMQVGDADGLLRSALHWLQNESDRRRAGEAARELVRNGRGAVQAHLERINELLGRT